MNKSKDTQKKRIVFLNDRFLPLSQARISVLDRGFLFGDGVYEVLPIYDGELLALLMHVVRLQKNLRAIYCDAVLNHAWIKRVILRLLRLNHAAKGSYSLYLQVTRGVDNDRNRKLTRGLKPTVFMMLRPISPLVYEELRIGKAAVTARDIRWECCYIKSISLLPTLLLQHQASRNNAEEVIIIRYGQVLEGGSSNVYIVRKGKIFIPPLSKHNLSGVTRNLIMQLARQHRLAIVEKDIAERSLLTADEIWISSSTR